MASITQYKDGYRAQVYVAGERDSRVFRTKREASAWASRREIELKEAAALSDGERHTWRDALERYRDEVSPTKKGSRWERVRIDLFLRIMDVEVRMVEVTPAYLAAFRDKRLKVVAPGSVLREFSLISAVLEQARAEWGWIKVNPAGDVRKPAEPPHRERVITRAEIRAILRAAGYGRGPVRSVYQAVAACFLLALRTGSRAGELATLAWRSVGSDSFRVDGKTGPRDVPIVPQTRRVLNQLVGWDGQLVVGVKRQTLDAVFRKLRDKAGLDGFTFHDSRHTAATWLAPHLNILDLCKMFGWKNPKQAMTYYNPKAADIARRLSERRGPRQSAR